MERDRRVGLRDVVRDRTRVVVFFLGDVLRQGRSVRTAVPLRRVGRREVDVGRHRNRQRCVIRVAPHVDEVRVERNLASAQEPGRRCDRAEIEGLRSRIGRVVLEPVHVGTLERLVRAGDAPRNGLTERRDVELRTQRVVIPLERHARREGRTVQHIPERVGTQLLEVLVLGPRVEGHVADANRDVDVGRRSTRVGRKGREERRTAALERVEHREEERQRRVDGGVRVGQSRRAARRYELRVKLGVDAQVVSEAVEVREIRPFIEGEQRRRVAVVLERRAVEEVRTDALILSGHLDLRDRQAEADDAAGVADRGDVAIVRRELTAGRFAEDHRARTLTADLDGERQREVDPEHGVADQRFTERARRVDEGHVTGDLRVVEVVDAVEGRADLEPRPALELLVQAPVDHVALQVGVVRDGDAAIGDGDLRTGPDRRAEDDRVVRFVVADHRQRVRGAAGQDAGVIVRRAVVERDVHGAKDRLLREEDLGQPTGAGVEGIRPQRLSRARLDEAGLRRDDRKQVGRAADGADARIDVGGLGVDHRLIHACDRAEERGRADVLFADRPADGRALLVRLNRDLIRNGGAIAERRAEGQPRARRRHVVDDPELDQEVRDRAGLGDVDLDARFDVDLRLLRVLAAPFEVEDVHRQRDEQVVADLVTEREAAVLADLHPRAGLRQRIVRVVAPHERSDEGVRCAAAAVGDRRAVVRRLRRACRVRNRTRVGRALAIRHVGKEQAVHRERLRELRALVERVERIFEVRHAHAERVELVLEGVDELLQFVEILLARARVRRRRFDILLQLRDDARDHDRHFIARERAIALELTIRVAVDDAVGRQALDVLVSPMVGRNIRERGSGGSPARHEYRAEHEARREDQASETLHKSSREVKEATASLQAFSWMNVPVRAIVRVA